MEQNSVKQKLETSGWMLIKRASINSFPVWFNIQMRCNQLDQIFTFLNEKKRCTDLIENTPKIRFFEECYKALTCGRGDGYGSQVQAYDLTGSEE
jgi:hypothetical protein